jgi:hypothetical protein
MFTKSKHFLPITALWFVSLAVSSQALAVGNGIVFNVNEGLVPGAFANALQANSLDFTYHACSDITINAGGQTTLTEVGFFWISSYQDANSVVDSQINHFAGNGYRIYGKYQFEAIQVGAYTTEFGERRDYKVESGSVSLFTDPNQDTMLTINNCQLVRQGDADDWRIGSSNKLEVGEKSEKEDIANGDFELRFSEWAWNVPDPIIPFASFRFIINANVTELNGLLDDNHHPEGSGNLFWKNLF